MRVVDPTCPVGHISPYTAVSKERSTSNQTANVEEDGMVLSVDLHQAISPWNVSISIPGQGNIKSSKIRTSRRESQQGSND